MQARLTTFMCWLGCLVGIPFANSYAQSKSIPEGVSTLQWHSLVTHWGLRARTATVTHPDGTSETGFLIGVYDEGLALVANSPHPFVSAEEMEVIVFKPEEVASITILRVNHLTHAPPSHTYFLGEDGLRWKQLNRRLRPYRQAETLAKAQQFAEYAPANPSDPDTWTDLAPVMPRAAWAFGHKPWSISVNRFETLHSGYHGTYPISSNFPLEPGHSDSKPFALTGSYTTPNGWEFGLTYRRQSNYSGVWYNFFPYPDSLTPLLRQTYRIHQREYMATLGYNIVNPTASLDRRSQLTLNAGIGITTVKEIADFSYEIFGVDDSWEYAGNSRSFYRINYQVALSYAYHLTPHWALQTQVVAQHAGEFQTLGLSYESPQVTLEMPSQRSHLTSVLWGFGIRYKL